MINDMHCGHLLGLTPPDWHRNDCTSWQIPAWHFYQSIVEQIGPVDDLIVNGDAIDGPGKKETTSHLTTDIGEQCRMAEQIISLPKADRIHIVKGTGFHTDGDTAYEDILAGAFGLKAHDELRLEVYGRKIHVRHVVGRSDIPYGQQTQMQKELINDILQAEFEDYQSADILLRAHDHYCFKVETADSRRGFMRIVYIAPALQMRGPRQSSFTRKLRTWKYDFGISLIEIDQKSREAFIRPFLMPIKHYARREYLCLTEEQK
ncbi:hypothetical protein [Marispirochaeta aestuarii]|uniref:hypothetical protein n=1 Tax=Marispirochaeta aestuarii TaxID=1963862 RepID=UPI00117761D2|nr:hypothetical protein [Marispirochaeta aestuarii]